MPATKRLDTWVNNELICVDPDETWMDTFLHWDGMVDTDIAVAIANATADILRKAIEDSHAN